MSGIDYIGTKRVAIRRTGDADYPSVSVRLLRNDDQLELDGEEWIELVGLITALKAAANFWDGAE